MKASQVLMGFLSIILLQNCMPRKYNEKATSDVQKFKFIDQQLVVEDAFRLPLKELSGLSWMCGQKKQNLFFAVGDKNLALAMSDSGESADLNANQGLTKLDSGFVEGGGAQFEAVACDRSAIFLLSEGLSKIAVLETGLLHPKALLELDVSTDPEIEALWHIQSPQQEEDANSNGEGMVLLKNGHILIAKEKNPPMLLEFAPDNESSPKISGFANLNAVGEADVFPIAKAKTGFVRRYVVTKSWTVGDDSLQASLDISELAVGPNGKLFILSDKSSAIAEVKANDAQKLKYERAWRLPPEIHKPEGLIFDDEGRAYVGVDGAKGGSPNVFKLSPIPGLSVTAPKAPL